MQEAFRKFAHTIAEAVGSPWAFVVAATVIAVWAVLGPATGFSSTWQLWINTGTTIVTFLMVFLIQNAQNRDSKAVELKLDELIHAIREANNELIDVEDKPDQAMRNARDRLVEAGLATSGTEEVTVTEEVSVTGKLRETG